MTTRILVAYATKLGATATIAATVAAELRAAGHEVDIQEVDSVPAVSPYDAVVVGSPLYDGRWRPEAVDFLRRHRHQLRARQVWFFHSDPIATTSQPLPADVNHLATLIHAHPVQTFIAVPRTDALVSCRARRRAQLEDFDCTEVRGWPAVRTWSQHVSSELAEATISV